MPIKCFFLEETGKIQRYLRRYHDTQCGAPWRWLNGMTPLDVIDWPVHSTISLDAKPDDLVPHSDPRWPSQCDCGHVFAESDNWQIFVQRIYRRADTGEEMILRNLPVGAMWDAYWMPNGWKGADGRCLTVICPDGHEWMIDSVASNCTLPKDPEHRCWIRHGEPPNLTVDKRAGIEGASAKTTCAAGAGSILTPKWHGFLRNGFLVE